MCEQVYAPAIVHMWRSEDNLQELALLSTTWVLGIYLLSHLPGPALFLLFVSRLFLSSPG